MLHDIGFGTGKYAPKTGTSSESSVTTKALAMAKKIFPGIVLIKLGGGGFQRAGIPDVYVGYKGVSIWVEFKLPGGDTTALQHATMKKMQETDLLCGIATSVDDFLLIISRAMEEYG